MGLWTRFVLWLAGREPIKWMAYRAVYPDDEPLPGETPDQFADRARRRLVREVVGGVGREPRE